LDGNTGIQAVLFFPGIILVNNNILPGTYKSGTAKSCCPTMKI
jgi:hypothetical protein